VSEETKPVVTLQVVFKTGQSHIFEKRVSFHQCQVNSDTNREYLQICCYAGMSSKKITYMVPVEGILYWREC